MKILLVTIFFLQSFCEKWFLYNDLSVSQEKKDSKQIAATADFNNTANSTGWAFIKIQTNYLDVNEMQFFYAGFIEGYLTNDLIYDAYRNYLGTVLEGNSELPNAAKQFIHDQLNWRISKHCKLDDLYSKYVCNMNSQLKGLYEGYYFSLPNGSKDLRYLDFDHFYYLTNMGDLEDIIPSFQPNIKKSPNCNAMVKRTSDGRILVAQSTHNIYSLMLRVYKTYQFALHGQVASNISFSARPGDLESKDDFFIMKEQQMVVVETSLNNWNKTNYEFMNPKTIPTWIRVNIASRLSTNANEWISHFQFQRSGTHNNQWLIVDFKQESKNLVVMVEESFFLFKYTDLTQTLLYPDSYVASFNVPYDQEIYKTTLYEEFHKYTYWNDPRSLQFKMYQADIQDVFGLGRLIRMNKNQTYGLCSDSISPRCDLSETGAYSFGGIDAKVIDLSMLLQDKVLLISSPSYQNLEPFSWTKFDGVPRYGMTDEWMFPWYTYNQKEFTIKNDGLDRI